MSPKKTMMPSVQRTLAVTVYGLLMLSPLVLSIVMCAWQDSDEDMHSDNDNENAADGID